MKVISISNRKLCIDDFLSRLEKISHSGVESIYLREKDISESEYQALAKDVLKVCGDSCNIYIVKYIGVAKILNCDSIHLSYSDFINNHQSLEEHNFKNVSVSVHSVGESIQAERLGATRLVTGHIFSTDCKKGIPPRGLEYLKSICNSVNIPVYAIGGITPQNAPKVAECGAVGVCVMSSLMQTESINRLVEKFF